MVEAMTASDTETLKTYIPNAYIGRQAELFRKCGVKTGGFVTGNLRKVGGDYDLAEKALHNASKLGYQFSAGEIDQHEYEASLSELAGRNSAYLTGKDVVTQSAKGLGNRTLLGIGGMFAGMALGSKVFGSSPAGRIFGFATTGIVGGALGLIGGFTMGSKIGDGIGSIADWLGESAGEDTWLGRNAKGLGDLVRRFTGAGHKVDYRDDAQEMLKRAAALGSDKAKTDGQAIRDLPKNGKVVETVVKPKTQEKTMSAATPTANKMNHDEPVQAINTEAKIKGDTPQAQCEREIQLLKNYMNQKRVIDAGQQGAVYAALGEAVKMYKEKFDGDESKIKALEGSEFAELSVNEIKALKDKHSQMGAAIDSNLTPYGKQQLVSLEEAIAAVKSKTINSNEIVANNEQANGTDKDGGISVEEAAKRAGQNITLDKQGEAMMAMINGYTPITAEKIVENMKNKNLQTAGS